MTIPGFDPSKPSVARVCDYLLGGYDNFAADREEAGRLLEICPSLPHAARENRAFITRAVTWAARQGIRQFADLGTGLPARHPAGEAARAVIPDARIAYVDNDPHVTSHARALLARDDNGIAAVDADLTDTAAILAHPGVRAVIDPAEPVCVILGLVLSEAYTAADIYNHSTGEVEEFLAHHVKIREAAPEALSTVSLPNICLR